MSKRKPYLRRVPNTWWLKHTFYTGYMIREATSVFIGIYTAILLVGLIRLYQGAEAYNAWLAALQSPLSILFHVVALLLALYHTVTWFAVTPKAMHVQIGTEKVPDSFIVIGHYGAAVVTSLIILLVVMGVGEPGQVMPEGGENGQTLQ